MSQRTGKIIRIHVQIHGRYPSLKKSMDLQKKMECVGVKKIKSMELPMEGPPC